MLCTPDNRSTAIGTTLHGLWHAFTAFAMQELVVVVAYIHALVHGGTPVLCHVNLYHLVLLCMGDKRVWFEKKDRLRDRHAQVKEWAKGWPQVGGRDWGLWWYVLWLLLPNLTTVVWSRNLHEIEQITDPDEHVKVRRQSDARVRGENIGLRRRSIDLEYDNEALQLSIRTLKDGNRELKDDTVRLAHRVKQQAATNQEWADYSARKAAEHARELQEAKEAHGARLHNSWATDRTECRATFDAWDVDGSGTVLEGGPADAGAARLQRNGDPPAVRRARRGRQ
jgi:hypothetical protein